MHMKRSFRLVSVAVFVFGFQAFSQSTDMSGSTSYEDSIDMIMLQANPTTVGEYLDDAVWQFDHIDTLIQMDRFDRIHNHAVKIGNDCKGLLAVGVAKDWNNHSKAVEYIKDMQKIAEKLKMDGDTKNTKAASYDLLDSWVQYYQLIKLYSRTYHKKSKLYESTKP